MSKETLQECPVCASKLLTGHNNTADRLREQDGEVIASIIQYALCLNCGIIFQNPRMDEADTHEYYMSGRYRASMNGDKKNPDDKEKKRAEYIYRYAYDRVTNSAAPESHLDIGSSRGYLLKSVGAKRRVGVDLYPEYCEFKDIEMYTSMDDVKGKFDLITIIHMLEHERFPVQALKDARSKLKPNGTLIVEVPAEPSQYGLPHLFVFKSWTLAYCLNRAGFEMIGVAFTPHILVTAKK